MTKRFLILALIIFAIAAAGLLTWAPYAGPDYQGRYDVILVLTLFGISMATFFGFLIIGSASGWDPTQGGMRISIAATLIVGYLFIVGTSIFLLPTGDVNAIT